MNSKLTSEEPHLWSFGNLKTDTYFIYEYRCFVYMCICAPCVWRGIGASEL